MSELMFLIRQECGKEPSVYLVSAFQAGSTSSYAKRREARGWTFRDKSGAVVGAAAIADTPDAGHALLRRALILEPFGTCCNSADATLRSAAPVKL